MEKEGGSGGGSRWREERKGLGEGMPEEGEDQVFFFFFWLGERQVRLTGGSKGRVRIRPWLARLRTLDA